MSKTIERPLIKRKDKRKKVIDIPDDDSSGVSKEVDKETVREVIRVDEEDKVDEQENKSDNQMQQKDDDSEHSSRSTQ
jgi:hypothetical protein